MSTLIEFVLGIKLFNLKLKQNEPINSGQKDELYSSLKNNLIKV